MSSKPLSDGRLAHPRRACQSRRSEPAASHALEVIDTSLVDDTELVARVAAEMLELSRLPERPGSGAG